MTKTQVVSVKCLMRQVICLMRQVGISPLCFSSIRFIVVLCLLKKTSIVDLCSQFESYQVITVPNTEIPDI